MSKKQSQSGLYWKNQIQNTKISAKNSPVCFGITSSEKQNTGLTSLSNVKFTATSVQILK